MRVKSGDFVQYLLTVDEHLLMIRKFEFDIDLMVKDIEKLIKSKEFNRAFLCLFCCLLSLIMQKY
jgi:hypothetical protein